MVLFEFQSLRLQLPSPKPGDTETVKLRTKIYRSMDNTLWSYMASPTQQVLRLEFGNVNRPKILEVSEFIKAAAGSGAVYYTDYDKVRWRGVILNTPFESTQVAPRNNTFTLEFEGVVVDDSDIRTESDANLGDTPLPDESDSGDGVQSLEA